MAVGEEEADTVGDKDTLLHGETLLVVATSDAEGVALEFIAERVGSDLLGDLLVVEDTAVMCTYISDRSRLSYLRLRTIASPGRNRRAFGPQ